ncbi:MAG: glycoside hydrolase family 9 protein, partial [Bacteroidota bacterium]
MKNHFLFMLLVPLFLSAQQWIRVNQAGYVPESRKIAVLVSSFPISNITSFTLHNALTDEPVGTFGRIKKYGSYGPFPVSFRLDFSNVHQTGSYYLSAMDVCSPVFTISPDVYNGSSDHLLRYMRQQRSGYNPYLNDSCHTGDGFIIYHPTMDSSYIDVSGGWHDAADYLQYVTTSATAVYQMLYAYRQHPASFGDSFGANGRPGKNGIPDILDEAKWGLDWLVKMNPQPEMYFNQIADDRDHRGFRLPTEDTVNYGRGKERPVYFITGKPQGIYQYKNRSTGSASTVAKFASAFALGSELLKGSYPEFSTMIGKKAVEAYEYAVAHPGVSQTAPCRAPYFYEEDNWVDDAELAASALYESTGEKKYLTDAVMFGRQEPVTPWMGADTASHYQWYPFTNLGHANIAYSSTHSSRQFISFLKDGIERVYQKGKSSPFLFGIPFIWCSNNFVSSFLEQLYLYRTLSHDTSYVEMESSLRDWLFGCNPWGTSMVVGLPAFGDSPSDPHSAFTHVYGIPINGGLVDGPVRSSIFAQHKKYIQLTKADPYAPFQSDLAVYHDDWGDYTNNEPTMDGTASMMMYLSSMEQPHNSGQQNMMRDNGGIIRMDTTKKEIYLVFTGHEFADGSETITSVLSKHKIKASFFFTGDFYRTGRFTSLI